MNIGDIKQGSEIGKDDHNYIWHVCEGCGKERWVVLKEGKPISQKCRRCGHLGHKESEETKRKIGLATSKRRGKLSGGYKRGSIVNSRGYIGILLQADDFFYPMADHSGYVLEHRLVIAKALARNLHTWEIVHHKNHDRKDNRSENLELLGDNRHNQITILEQRIKYLENKIAQLEATNQSQQ